MFCRVVLFFLFKLFFGKVLEDLDAFMTSLDLKKRNRHLKISLKLISKLVFGDSISKILRAVDFDGETP